MNIQLFDFSVDLLQTLLWQYNNATKIQSLLQSKNDWYEEYETQFWNDWYDNVFNLVTANSFGLSIWSILLGIPLFILIGPDPADKPVFGFNTDTPTNNNQNFGNGNFAVVENIGIGTLTIEEQRLLLRLRYFQLTSRGAIPETNAFLNYLFEGTGGTVWALDGFDMTMTYVFTSILSPALRQIIKDYDVLPRPAAVGIKRIILTGSIFGFGVNNQNFENGNFIQNF